MVKQHSLLICGLFLCIILTGCRDTVKLDVGVSLDLARFRKERISDLAYQLIFRIPEKIQDSIMGGK